VSSPAKITLASTLSAQELAGLGLEAGEILPIGEWFVRPDAARPEAARLRRETPVVGAFETLVVTDPTLNTIVATTSIHFNDVPSIIECQTSAGRILVCAIAPERLATAPEIGRYLDRLSAGGSATTRTIGVGIVGYGPFGGMGYTHGLAATETDGLAFVGVCDSSDERRLAAMADFPTVQGHIALLARAEVRLAKLYDLSDQIRDGLAAAGVEVRDTADGQIWELITPE
jgi:hypothetical protein